MKKINTFFCALFLLFSGSAFAAIESIGNVTGSYIISSGDGSSDDNAAMDTEVETFLGMDPDTLDSNSPLKTTEIDRDAFEGSAIKDIISISEDDVFSFNWHWSLGEEYESGIHDFAFVSLSLENLDGIVAISMFSVLADTSTPHGTDGTFRWEPTTSGVLTYGIGVMDYHDSFGESILEVDKIGVVPVPAAVWLFGSAIAGFAGFSRLKKAQKLK
jgi:hypothetical protein